MRNSKSEKELHIELWQESGLSKVEYATQSGLNPYTFYSWFKKAKATTGETNTTDFVEINSIEKHLEPAMSDIKISLPGGYEITVASGFDRTSLSAVVEILEGR